MSKSVEFIRGHSKQVHGITDAMVRGKPTVEHVLPQFIEFLDEANTILLAHNAPFDLGFLAMALIRLGIAYPPHDVCDTLEMTRRLYPTWPSHNLENVAIRLNVANKAEHRALSDARVVKDVFLAMRKGMPIVTSKGDLVPLSPPLSAAKAPPASSPPQGCCARHPAGPLESDVSGDRLLLPVDEDAWLGWVISGAHPHRGPSRYRVG